MYASRLLSCSYTEDICLQNLVSFHKRIHSQVFHSQVSFVFNNIVLGATKETVIIVYEYSIMMSLCYGSMFDAQHLFIDTNANMASPYLI